MATATSTSAAASIVQAAEHVAVEEAKIIAEQLSTKAAADVKNIVHEVAQQAVEEASETPATILEDVKDGLGEVVEEVVKGAEKVVEQVEAHPELLVEGALAVGIGVASVVQPELIAGSVALVGKMAADSVTETMNDIIVTSSTGVVKEVVKDVADDSGDAKAKDAEDKDDKTAPQIKDSKAEPAPGDESASKEEKPIEGATDKSASENGKSDKSPEVEEKKKDTQEELKEPAGPAKAEVDADKDDETVAEPTVEAKLEDQSKDASSASITESKPEAGPIDPPKESEEVAEPSQEGSAATKETEISLPTPSTESFVEVETSSKEITKETESSTVAKATSPQPTEPSNNIATEAPRPRPQLWTKPSDSSNFTTQPLSMATPTVDTHAAVIAAHQSITELHQKLDKMQSSLDAMAKAILAHGIKSPIEAIEAAVTEIQTETAAGTANASTAEMSLVLADPRKAHPIQHTYKKRESIFSSFRMGWLFGGGSGTKGAPATVATTTTNAAANSNGETET